LLPLLLWSLSVLGTYAGGRSGSVRVGAEVREKEGAAAERCLQQEAR
jgi:hypothetical protein